VIELALRFGYDSPDSFPRAFRREFGCQPSDGRRDGVTLHSYPRLTLTVVLRGDNAMEYRIEEGPPLSSEWLPASDWERAVTAEIEYYSSIGSQDSLDYWSEYWVPLRIGGQPAVMRC